MLENYFISGFFNAEILLKKTAKILLENCQKTAIKLPENCYKTARELPESHC